MKKILKSIIVLILCLSMTLPYIPFVPGGEVAHAQSTGNLIGGGIALSGAAATVGATINAALIGTLTLSAIPVAGWVAGIFLIIACLALCSGSTPTPQTPGFAGVTVRDNGGLFGWGSDNDPSRVNARYAYETNGSWSSRSRDNDLYSLDRAAIYNHNVDVPPGLDFQLCVNATNKDQKSWNDHDPQCTGWASESTTGTWSGYSAGYNSMDGIQVSVRSQPMEGSVTDYRFGIRVYKGGSNSCGSLQGTSYTPWTRGWSSYIGTSDTFADTHCVRVYLESTLNNTYVAAPVVSLYRHDGPGATAGTILAIFNDATIPWNEPLELGWSSSNASTCTSPDFSTSNLASSDLNTPVPISLAAGSSKTYTITCTGDGGQTATDTLTITRGVPPFPLPSATLSRCNATTDTQNCSSSSSGWGTGNLTIITGHVVKLRWTSANSTSCSGSGFATGGATSNNAGVNVTTAATPANSPLTYTLICDDINLATDPGSSSVSITANSIPPTLTGPTGAIPTGEDFTLKWNLNGNNPTTCSFTSGVNAPASVASATEATIEAVGTSTYTLTCAGGSASVTVQVTPLYYES